MLKNLDLQTVLLFFFGVLLVMGIFVFSGIIPSPKSAKEKQIEGAKVVVWGTLPEKYFQDKTIKFIKESVGTRSITYIERSAERFDADLIEKLAADAGPDIILLPDSLIARYAEKVSPLPYESYPERQFLESFVQGSEIYLRPEGILALPFSIDPMVMYWNRNMFSAASVVRPPAYWDEMLTLTPVLTKRDNANNIIKSAVAFGEYANVTHAKEILSTLILQTGNPVTRYDEKKRDIVSTLTSDMESTFSPAADVFSFYTDFADPLKTVYSWNRSLAPAKDAFLAQDLAIYFGFASEAEELQEKNPNLDFGTAPIPQIRDYPFRATFARMTAVAVMKTSAQKTAAHRIALVLSSAFMADMFSKGSGLPPVRRDLLGKRPATAKESVFYDSAIIGKSWLDPNPTKSKEIFQSAIESILARTLEPKGAVSKMAAQLSLIDGK